MPHFAHTDVLTPIPFCSALYKTQWLFPSSPEDEQAYGFYIVLVTFSLLIISYVLIGIGRQQHLLRKGQITEMKRWLLPVYYRFLWFMIFIYGCKAIDTTVVYLIVDIQECQMLTPIAALHAASFWSSEFWMLDALFLFLASNSHGIATIRRSFYISSILWIFNSMLITIGLCLCLCLSTVFDFIHIYI